MKKFSTRLFITIFCLLFCIQSVCAAQLVVPGGQVIGLELRDQTVTVAALDPQGERTGLQIGDQILSVNEKNVRSVQDVKDALKRCDGETEITVIRNGKETKFSVEPQISPDGPKLGVYLKQGITGVGTVTWYDPASGNFGALGHGVNNSAGDLVPMEQGTVYNASVITVKTGKIGTPGQLMSTVTGTDGIGSLTKNTVQGVFGTAELSGKEDLLPVGTREDVHTGQATIRSTVAGNQIQEYSVEIMKVYPNSGKSGRNMLLRVSDPELLSVTGGIVQGMSGSPIIQDGKLIGAVTHVLINDPTMGYGIFIENMLDAAA